MQTGHHTRLSGRLFPLLAIYLMSFCLLLVLAPPAGSTPDSGEAVKPNHMLTDQKLGMELQDLWGIELTALRLTASGHMIDFRYRVTDTQKAAPLFARQTKPVLVHELTGKVLAVPNTAKVGSLRNSNMPQKGRIYWMFFGNNGLVKNGDKVSIVIGAFKAENLIIE